MLNSHSIHACFSDGVCALCVQDVLRTAPSVCSVLQMPLPLSFGTCGPCIAAQLGMQHGWQEV
jgi:predicted amidophosphoribosyltransferase